MSEKPMGWDEMAARMNEGANRHRLLGEGLTPFLEAVLGLEEPSLLRFTGPCLTKEHGKNAYELRVHIGVEKPEPPEDRLAVDGVPLESGMFYRERTTEDLSSEHGIYEAREGKWEE